MKTHWGWVLILLCMSSAAWAQDPVETRARQGSREEVMTEARIRQIIREEIEAREATDAKANAVQPTVEAVRAALAREGSDPGWYAITPNSARRSEGETESVVASEVQLPRQSSKREVQETLVKEEKSVPPAALAGAAGVTTADNAVSQENSAIELLATAEGAAATIRLGTKGDGIYSTQSGRVHKRTWSFLASAPIDKDSGRATFASLTGPGNGLTLGLSTTYSSAPAKSAAEPTGWSRIINFESEVGYNDFDYYTSLTETEKDREMRWMLGGTLATSSPQRVAYFGAGFRVQQGYRSQKPRIVCPPPADDTFDCVQGSFGAPKRTTQRIAYVEARGEVLKRPISLRLSHDFANDLSSADLPIYLLRNARSKFTGGLRLGWDSDNDFVAGVFVGKEFSIE